MSKKLSYTKYLSLPVKVRLQLVQRSLIDNGYQNVSITGKRDKNTIKALLDFQRNNDINPNAVVCEATYSLLDIRLENN